MDREGVGAGSGVQRGTALPETVTAPPVPFLFWGNLEQMQQCSAKPEPFTDGEGGLSRTPSVARMEGWRSVVRSCCFRSPSSQADMPGSDDGWFLRCGESTAPEDTERDAFRASHFSYTDDVREASRPHLRSPVGFRPTTPLVVFMPRYEPCLTTNGEEAGVEDLACRFTISSFSCAVQLVDAIVRDDFGCEPDSPGPLQ